MDTYLILLDGKMEIIYLKDFPDIGQESIDHFFKMFITHIWPDVKPFW